MSSSHRLIIAVAIALAAVLAFAPVHYAQVAPETIAIVGTGNVAETLGPLWAAAGHTIIYGSRTPGDARVQELARRTGNGARVATQAEAAAAAGIIVLAVPGTVVVDVVGALGSLDGRIVLDPTNTVTFEDGYFVSPTDPRVSIAERVQQAAPGARVVKAFNTTGVHVMADPAVAGGPVTIPLSGDDVDAKARVARLVRDIGLEPLDVGPLASARFLEEMLRLYIAYRRTNPGQSFEFYLRPTP